MQKLTVVFAIALLGVATCQNVVINKDGWATQPVAWFNNTDTKVWTSTVQTLINAKDGLTLLAYTTNGKATDYIQRLLNTKDYTAKNAADTAFTVTANTTLANGVLFTNDDTNVVVATNEKDDKGNEQIYIQQFALGTGKAVGDRVALTNNTDAKLDLTILRIVNTRNYYCVQYLDATKGDSVYVRCVKQGKTDLTAAINIATGVAANIGTTVLPTDIPAAAVHGTDKIYFVFINKDAKGNKNALVEITVDVSKDTATPATANFFPAARDVATIQSFTPFAIGKIYGAYVYVSDKGNDTKITNSWLLKSSHDNTKLVTLQTGAADTALPRPVYVLDHKDDTYIIIYLNPTQDATTKNTNNWSYQIYKADGTPDGASKLIASNVTPLTVFVARDGTVYGYYRDGNAYNIGQIFPEGTSTASAGIVKTAVVFAAAIVGALFAF